MTVTADKKSYLVMIPGHDNFFPNVLYPASEGVVRRRSLFWVMLSQMRYSAKKLATAFRVCVHTHAAHSHTSLAGPMDESIYAYTHMHTHMH
jgi:hypothetical protein